jgi:Asp-tRNA(Asn)/Glu-tRNA(Gln) amidotransferase C subunit
MASEETIQTLEKIIKIVEQNLKFNTEETNLVYYTILKIINKHDENNRLP